MFVCFINVTKRNLYLLDLPEEVHKRSERSHYYITKVSILFVGNFRGGGGDDRSVEGGGSKEDSSDTNRRGRLVQALSMM